MDPEFSWRSACPAANSDPDDNAPLRPPAISPRYKFGFYLGGLCLGLVVILWLSSRSTGHPTGAGDILSAGMVPAPAALPTASGSFARGAALYDVLVGASLPPAQAFEVGRALKKVLDPKRLRSDDRYEILRSPEGAFQSLAIVRDLRRYVVDASAGALKARTEDVPLSSRERSAAGRLKGSLWTTMREQGLDPQLIMAFADIFAWNVDFLTEPRDGDAFSLVWEEKTTPSGEAASREIAAALYEGRNTGRQTAVRLGGDYYQENGDSLRRAFLHAPLNFRRISSGFTHRRFHPILRYFRPHLGIDYAAPKGTPVVSVGDGVVTFRGWKGGFGNFVKVRHNGMYTTCYGHFSRFAKGMRAGRRVRQGEVIGYVGSTGHATGPHLDFRVIQNGKFVNFLKLRVPPDRRVPAQRKAAFEEIKRRRMEELEELLRDPSAG